MIEKSSTDERNEELIAFNKEVEARLLKLVDQDRTWFGLIAARASLRVLPLVSLAGRFDFWDTKTALFDSEAVDPALGEFESEDRRIYYLLAVYSAVLIGQSQSAYVDVKDNYSVVDPPFIRLSDVAQTAYNVATAASRDAQIFADSGTVDADLVDAAKAASAATRYASVHASQASDNSGFVDAVSLTISRAAHASEYGYFFNHFVDAVKTDLSLAERGIITDLHGQPLWHGQPPKEVLLIYRNKFKPAVEALLDSAKGDAREALNKLLTDYDGWLDKEQPMASNELSPETPNVMQDRLGREALVQGLADILTDERNTEHQTIGLFGHWGVGKSVVLELLKKKLKADTGSCRFLVGTFNAWSYEHVKNIQAAMAHEVIRSLTTYQNYYDPWTTGGDSVDKPPELEENSVTGPQMTNRIHRVLAVIRFSWMNKGLSHLGRVGKRMSHLHSRVRDKCAPFVWRVYFIYHNMVNHLAWVILVRIPLTWSFAWRKYPYRASLLIVFLGMMVLCGLWLLYNGLATPGSVGVVLAGTLAGFPAWNHAKTVLAQPLTKELLTYVTLPGYIQHIGEVSEMRRDVRSLCDIRLGNNYDEYPFRLGPFRRGRRLLFIVDDLDRCSPQGIVKAFEAVRLIMDIPQVTVLIAIDQRVALAAFAHHYRELKDFHDLRDAHAIARDYLSKMIHLSLKLDKPDKAATNDYLGHMWSEDNSQTNARLAQLDTPPISRAGSLQSGDELNSGGQSTSGSNELSMDDLVQNILNTPSPSRESSVEGLTSDQKAAFLYWADQLGLTNPRQLRRLHNSYNLLRKVKDRPDYEIALQPSTNRSVDYLWMLALMVLEYINAEEDSCKRRAYRGLIRRSADEVKLKEVTPEPLMSALKRIEGYFEQQTREDRTEPENVRMLFKWVEQFVLPAIDGKGVESINGQQ